MASIYKPTRVDPETGERVKYRCWRIAYIDENGTRRTVKGFKDKAATEARAREIEKNVERKKAGLPVAQDVNKSTEEAIDAWIGELVRRGSPPRGPHTTEVRRQLTRLRKDCDWQTLRSITSVKFSEWLANRSIEGRAPRTINHHHKHLRSFLDWCVKQGWLAHNPIQQMKLVKVGQKGRRRLRRAYTLDEWTRLINATPEPRRTIYMIASLSGFRRKEMQKLEKRDCTPIGDRPCWHPRPEIEKSGRGDKIPMLPECAELLRPIWEQIPQPNGRLFKAIPIYATLNADLKNAGIPRQDERGRWADFHSFRYTFCTFLGKTLPIQKVKILMRHSTIQLTADLYTDLGLDEVGEGVWTLPRLLQSAPKNDALPQAHTLAAA